MTSTEQINDLIQGYTDLKINFETMYDSLDAGIAELRTSMSLVRYVNENAGNDAAAGGENTPYKTLAHAIAQFPAGSTGKIIFKTSVTISTEIQTRAQHLIFEAYPGVAAANLKVGWYLDEAGNLRPGQINFAGSYGTAGFSGVGLYFDAMPAGTRATDYSCGVFLTNSLTPPAHIAFFNCAITRHASSEAFLLATSSNTASLNVSSNVTVSPLMAGRWFAGVAADTPTGNTRYNTNLATL